MRTYIITEQKLAELIDQLHTDHNNDEMPGTVRVLDALRLTDARDCLVLNEPETHTLHYAFVGAMKQQVKQANEEVARRLNDFPNDTEMMRSVNVKIDDSIGTSVRTDDIDEYFDDAARGK